MSTNDSAAGDDPSASDGNEGAEQLALARPGRAGDERMWAVGDEVDLDDAVGRPPESRDRPRVAAASPPRCGDRIRVECLGADEVHELDGAVEIGAGGMELRVAPPGEARGDRPGNLARAAGHHGAPRDDAGLEHDDVAGGGHLHDDLAHRGKLRAFGGEHHERHRLPERDGQPAQRRCPGGERRRTVDHHDQAPFPLAGTARQRTDSRLHLVVGDRVAGAIDAAVREPRRPGPTVDPIGAVRRRAAPNPPGLS